MKRRWLIALTAIVLTITMCMGFAACGQSDADTAKDAIETIQAMYKDQIPAETATDFKVVGQTKVEEQVYTVNWSVTSSTENITDYVKIGTMDETTKLITIGITKGADVINYTLTASVTVGDATESVSFERKIPAKAKDAAGTEDDPYSVARALEIANSLEPNDYFGGKENPTRVYVHGYIVDCGKQFNETRISYVYIVDEYDDSKTSKSPDAFDIYSITYDEVNCTCQEDLTKGAEIVVSGYIMLYQKSGQTTTQPELTYFGDGNVTCSYLEKKERTPDEKVALALSKVESNLTVSKAGEFELPTSTVKDVTFAWKTESTTYPLTTDGKKLQVSALPTEDATVTLTLTATCGTASDTKTVTVTVKAAGANDGSVEKPFTVAEALEIGSKLASGKFYQVDGKNAQVHIAGYVTDVGTVNTYNGEVKGLQNVLIADEKGGTETLKLSFVYWNDVMEKPADDSNPLKVGDYVVVYGFLENYNNNVNVYYSGGVYPEFTTWNEKVSQQQPVGPGEDEEEVFTAITSPEEGTYIMGMVVEDTVYYLKGGIDRYYLATSSDPQDAVEVTLAVSGDGYVIKCGAQFIEVETSGTHINAVYKDAQTAGKVWKWNEEHQLFTMDEGGKTYYLGTYWEDGYNYPYNTIGASDFSRYSETKQYHARLGNFAVPVEPETDDAKAQAVADALELTKKEFTAVNDELTLVATGKYGTTITWKLTNPTTSDLVKIENGKLTVLQLPETDATLELTATVTCGTASKTKAFTITVKAANTEPTNYGTLENPLSVSEALALAEEECVNNGDYTAQKVYAIGIATSTPESAGTYYKEFNLKDQNDSATIVIYTINLDAEVAAPAQNDLLIVCGYITRFKFGDTTGAGTDGIIEFSGKGDDYVYCKSNTRGESEISTQLDGATVAGLPQSNKATNGQEVTFTVQPAEGKKISSVKAYDKALTEKDGSYTFTMNGNVTIEVKAIDEEAQPSLEATIQYSGTTTGNMSGDNDANTVFGLDASIFTIQSEKTNSGNNHIGLNKAGQLRFYKNKTATLHIKVTDAYVIESIKVTLDSKSPQPISFLSVVAGEQSITGNEGVYVINGTSVSLSNTSTASSDNQIYVKTILITYKAVGGSTPEPEPKPEPKPEPSESTNIVFDFSFNSSASTTVLDAAGAKAYLMSAGNSPQELTDVTEVANAYKGNSSGGPGEMPGTLKLGKNGGNGKLVVTFGKNVTKVVVKWVGWSASKGKLTVNGKECAGFQADNPADEEFVLTSPSSTLTIESTERVLIVSMTVYFEA